MCPELEYAEERLKECRKLFSETGITLATLAVIRRHEATISDVRELICRYTAGIMSVDERRLALELKDLEREGYAEPKGDKYHITMDGKNFMFSMLKEWNKYVDSMNNLWGCYYGA